MAIDYKFASMRSVVLAVCLIVVSVATAGAEKRIALVIGNSSYTQISALANPRNDARLMAKALRDVGFEVVVATDANRLAMGRAIRKFGRTLRRAGSDAVGLFYYAGHGVQANGGNYLIPLGALIEDNADLDIEALSASDVLRQMEAAGNRLNLVVLDACRNNPFKGKIRTALRGLSRIEAASGAMIAFSAAPGQVSADGIGDNSPYTSALVAAMRKPGLKVEEVFKRVRVQVERETGGTQTPWEESSLRGEFYFTPGLQRKPAETVKAPGTVPPRTKADRDTWTAIQTTESKAILRAFIREYPNSVYAKFARARLSELEEQSGRQTTIPTPPTTRADEPSSQNTGEPETAKQPVTQRSAPQELAKVDPRQPGTSPGPSSDNYGSIAFSQETGAHGYAYDYATQTEAQDGALAECAKYGGGCKVASWFRNGCGALAVGDDRGWGADWGNSRNEAENKALQRCGTHTSKCKIIRWACTKR